MVYLELVPSAAPEWEHMVSETMADYPFLSGINIPDILRVSVRSPAAALRLANIGISAIPHIRAMDRDIPTSLQLIGELIAGGVTAVLIVSGDAPQNPSALCFEVSAEMLISAVKAQYPALTVYAALDPYRQSIRGELAYCKRKQEAGADGFFSQPFFDPRLAEIYLEQLHNTAVFLGIAPVITDNSVRYWMTTNHVVFPPQFSLTLEDNATLSRELMALATRYGQHAYLMPIKVPIRSYLDAVRGLY
jgi:methylenetetrahydrofolate reductase (NADPH)